MNILDELKTPLFSSIDLINSCIENCPDELWDKRGDGPVYWQQIYHVLTSFWLFLPVTEGNTHNYPSLDEAANIRKEYSGQTPGKDILSQIAKESVNHARMYFNRMNESMLATEIDFKGRVVRIFDLIILATTHAMYHVGICDAMLIRNGGQAVMYGVY